MTVFELIGHPLASINYLPPPELEPPPLEPTPFPFPTDCPLLDPVIEILTVAPGATPEIAILEPFPDWVIFPSVIELP